VRANCRRAVEQSQALCERSKDLDVRTRGLLAGILEVTTRLEDEPQALRDARIRHLREARIERLSQMIGRSSDIERAKRIIAEERNCSRGEAFAAMRRVSQRRNVKLRDLARIVVESRRAS
jgi:AmiR/NasT family two-component response regulator